MQWALRIVIQYFVQGTVKFMHVVATYVTICKLEDETLFIKLHKCFSHGCFFVIPIILRL